MSEQPKRNARTTEGLVAEYAEVLDQLDRLAERKAELELILSAKLGPGKHEVGELKLTVKNGSRSFVPTAFAKKFPADQFPQYYEQKPAVAKIKPHFSPNDLAEFYGEPGKGSVSLA
jgi:hypothetical protein